ncbi:MAG TPA: surface-adhesin E family protein [Burkholderiales bacterium]|nr:surface-adhesin E family protein [Burkholderiales bacterium]
MPGRILLCFLIVAYSAATSAVERWRAFPTSATNVLFSVDEASLVREGDVVKFRERIVYVVPEVYDAATGKGVKEKRVHRMMHCKDRTQAHLYATKIAEDGRSIEEIHQSEDKLQMTPIRPNSIADEELRWACKVV